MSIFGEKNAVCAKTMGKAAMRLTEGKMCDILKPSLCHIAPVIAANGGNVVVPSGNVYQSVVLEAMKVYSPENMI